MYLHVPFCLKKCRYCDFFSLPFVEDSARQFVQAACRELAARSEELAGPVTSIFFGGGTPTVLGGELLEELLRAVQPYRQEHTEFSVEANPGLLDEALTKRMARWGVNRLHLGVQSFDEKELGLLGRLHTAEQARQALDLAKSAGIASVGLDLMYGIPGQSLARWQHSLQEALTRSIEHISCYALSFEAGTPLRADLEAGRLRQVPDTLQHQFYTEAITRARQAGLEHYEISNFAKPGHRCRHNLTYWHNRPYVGIGPGAASYDGQTRKTNKPDLPLYTESLLAGQKPPATSERLTGPIALAETFMLGLRLIDGVERSDFTERFGQDPVSTFPESFGRYQDLGLVEITDTHVRISSESLFVSDSILADILAEARQATES